MIQIITTDEQMQDVFDKAFDKAMLKYQKIEFKPEPIIMTGDELCVKLDVTIQTLIRWRHKGKIPYMQIGSSVRYDYAKVLEALEAKSR